VNGSRRVVLRGGYHARYASSGHLLYVHQGTLFAAPFDLDRLETTGAARPVLDRLATTENNGGAQFAFSNEGMLIYAPATPPARAKAYISWALPEGDAGHILSAADYYSSLRFAPDGLKLAFVLWDGAQHDIYVCDWRSQAKWRRTFDPADEESPVWTPDSSRIAFSSDRENRSVPNIYWMRTDGAGEVRRLTVSSNWQQPTSWHPNGKILLLNEMNPKTGMDVMALPIEGDEKHGWVPGKVHPVLNGRASESNAVFSPNGRWVAYESNAGNVFEIYVQAFPGPGGPWQVSTGGGYAPTWSPNGKGLYFRTGGQRLMFADCTTDGRSFSAQPARLWGSAHLAQGGRTRNFDIHPDGKRIAALMSTEPLDRPRRDRLVFVLNFFEELRRLAPSRTP
jgi:serine/threonine-protein kinase